MAKPTWHSITVALTIACPRVMLTHARVSNNSLRTNQLGRAQLARDPEVAEVGKLHRPTSRRRNLRRGFSEFSVNSFHVVIESTAAGMETGTEPPAQAGNPSRKYTIRSNFGQSRTPRSRKNRPCDACRRRKTACVIPNKPPCE